MKKPLKSGRPKLPKGAAKSKTVRARLSPEEHAKIKKAADVAGFKLSDWVRKLLLDAA
jgi:uncharacterized protein (DUF1778 family)